jgi:hypothetical protein
MEAVAVSSSLTRTAHLAYSQWQRDCSTAQGATMLVSSLSAIPTVATMQTFNN